MESVIMALSYSSISGGGGAASNDFTITTGASGYTSVTLSTSFPIGSYVVTSSLSDASMDIYLIAEDGTSAGYVNTVASSSTISATKSFNRVVIYGGSNNDTITFQFKYVFSLSEIGSSDTGAAATITSLSTSSMPNTNSSTTVTGRNFATDVSFAFIGTDSVSRSAKSVTRSSSTSATVVRPDTFPPEFAPYTIQATNPGIALPTSTNLHRLSSTVITKPGAPTSVSAAKASTAGAITVSFTAPATGGSTITGYTVTSSPGSLTASGASSPLTVTGLTTGTSYTFTVTATNASGTSDASSPTSGLTPPVAFTQAFTSSGNFTVPNNTSNLELTVVAGGGSTGEGYAGGGGGGAGGVAYSSSRSVTPGATYAITIGAGGNAPVYNTSTGNNTVGNAGGATTFGALVNAAGGGRGGGVNGAAQSGGSGGGAFKTDTNSGSLTNNAYGNNTVAGQGQRGGSAIATTGGGVGGGSGAGGGYSNVGGSAASNQIPTGGNGFSIPGYNAVAGGGSGSIWSNDAGYEWAGKDSIGMNGAGGGGRGWSVYATAAGGNPGLVFMRYNA
jgi:hypothetical protein